MQLFYNSELKEGQTSCTLDREERNHLVKVLRKNIGDIVHFTNGNGLLAKGAIRMISSNSVDIELTESHLKQPPKPQLTMVVAPTKNNDRYEWFLEKATEIGVREITPIITRYSEKKKINFERAERVLISSMKQSYQFYKPKINSIINFSDFLIQNNDFKIMANLKTTRLITANDLKSNNICLMIGPEGGFSDEEIIEARGNNILEISLGKNRLRSETAAVHSLSIIKTLLNL